MRFNIYIFSYKPDQQYFEHIFQQLHVARQNLIQIHILWLECKPKELITQ